MLKYKYIVVESATGKAFYLARQQVGMPTYKVIGTYNIATLAKLSAEALNQSDKG